MPPGPGVGIVSGAGRPATRRADYSYVELDPQALDELLRSTAGPVARALMEKAHRVKAKAQQLVGVSDPDPVPRRRPRRPGTLRDSIVTRMLIDRGELAVSVGSAQPYALYHHEGIPGGVIITPKKPLTITKSGKRKGGVLVFYWKGTAVSEYRGTAPAEGIYYRRWVRQGRVPPNRFLQRALDA